MRLSNEEVLLRWPLDQHILTQGWHYNSGRSHNGIDLRTQIGNTAVSVKVGLLTRAMLVLWDYKEAIPDALPC